MGLLTRTKDAPAPRPGPRRPSPDRQCTGQTLRQTRCTGWTAGGTDRCSTHRIKPTRTSAVDAITASVATVELDGVGWQTWRPGSRAWQTEAWRLYDITGQLRFVSGWIGNSCSACRLYVAEVGDDGEIAGETEDPEIAALAAGPLGTGPAKDEALRLLAINLYVPGEGYIVAEAEGGDDGEDLWWVVSGNQIRRTGDRVVCRRSLLHGGGDHLFRPGVDLLLRCWTPHPADTDEPDSPTRSAIPDLREIEAIRKREFAELDSRLAGAGLLPLPAGIEFPRGDDDPPGIEGFYKLLQRVMGTSLQNRASAEALVPILFTVPDVNMLDKIKLITFWSELSDQLLPMREAAVRSLAQSLDVPPEILLGVGDVNHWTGWLVSEDAVKTQVAPVLGRIADALTTGYLRSALEALGKDPTRYVYAFDTSTLTTRANRVTDALSYHDKLLLSDKDAVEAGAFRPEQMPTVEEKKRRIVEKALIGAPSLLGNPILAGLIGIELPPGTVPAEPGQPAPAPAPGQPAPPPAPAPAAEPRAIPTQPTDSPDGGPDNAASALVAVASMAVRRALALAGTRLVPHTQRDRYTGTAKHDLHTRHGPISADQADRVLRGAWVDLDESADELGLDGDQLRQLLHGFTVELLTRGMAYEAQLLRDLCTMALRCRRLDALASVA